MKIPLIFFFLIFVAVHSQTVDTNYGTGGKLYVDIPPTANKEYNKKTFYTTDKKTVNFGYFNTGSFSVQTYFVTKYNSNGTRDTNFATNGILDIPRLPNSTGSITVSSAIMQNDDSMILSCHDDKTAYLIKIMPNGDLDASFGNNGFMIADFLSTANILTSGDLMRDEQNRIFVVYASYNSTTIPAKRYTNLCKILPNGSVDTNFGTNGFSSLLLNRDNYFRTLKNTRIKNGKIYSFATLAYSNIGTSQLTDVWTCHSLDGTPDATFGDNGYFYTTEDFTIYDYNVQQDGKILTTRYVAPGSATQYVKSSRYLRSGALDTSFGNGGHVQSSFGQWSMHTPYKIMEMPDHNIYVFCDFDKNDAPTENAGTILKYDANGVPDSSFGINGIFKFSAYFSSITDVSVTGDDGFIISVQNNASGSLFNMKVNYEMNFLSTDTATTLSHQIRVYPNPVTNFLYVGGVKNEQFTIYNSIGQIVKTGSYIMDKGIEVHELTNGTYWLKVDHSKAVLFIKK